MKEKEDKKMGPQWVLDTAELPEFTQGLRGTEMAEIVVAEATGKCPETETQTD